MERRCLGKLLDKRKFLEPGKVFGRRESSFCSQEISLKNFEKKFDTGGQLLTHIKFVENDI